MPDVDEPQPGNSDQPSAAEPVEVPQSLEQARAQVVALEREQLGLLVLRAEDLQRENERLRQMPPTPAGTTSSSTDLDLLTPAYLARALTAVEGHVADMDGCAAVGDHGGAATAKVMAVTRACSTFSRLCEDDGFHDVLMRMQVEADEHEVGTEGLVAGDINGQPFRDLEVQLLELAGLSRQLAEQHVDAAIGAYRDNPTESMLRLKNPMQFLGDLRALRDATCQSADLLAAGVRRQQSRARWKKVLTFGLGGTLIVAANAIGTTVLGPGGVAASAAIGSAAVGVAAPLIS